MKDRQNALKIAVINYESVWRDGIFDALLDYQADLIIADESQRIKTHNAIQSRAMHKLGDQTPYKMILSGTPVQNNALDMFSQYRFLDRRVFGDNFYVFRNRYAIMGGFENRQIIGYQNMDQLIQKEHSIALRVTKEEALDLPEQTFENRYISLDPKEQKLYDKLRRDSYAKLETGGQITAQTILIQLLRLQQLAGGFLVEDTAPKPRLIHRKKLDAIADILTDYVLNEQKKLVIFARFLPEVLAIIQLSNSLFACHKIKTVAIYGGVPKEDRGEFIRQFQTDPQTMVFVGQIDSAGVGITLTAADTCVYYSVNFNYAAYSQSLSRIHRIGQKNRCTYIHLIAEKTIDENILRVLNRKENLAKSIVNNWRDYF